mgnify:CR=1 FL=1
MGWNLHLRQKRIVCARIVASIIGRMILWQILLLLSCVNELADFLSIVKLNFNIVTTAVSEHLKDILPPYYTSSILLPDTVLSLHM